MLLHRVAPPGAHVSSHFLHRHRVKSLKDRQLWLVTPRVQVKTSRDASRAAAPVSCHNPVTHVYGHLLEAPSFQERRQAESQWIQDLQLIVFFFRLQVPQIQTQTVE